MSHYNQKAEKKKPLKGVSKQAHSIVSYSRPPVHVKLRTKFFFKLSYRFLFKFSLLNLHA